MRIIILTSQYSPSVVQGIKTLIESPKLSKNNIKVVGIVSAELFGINAKTFANVWKFIKKAGVVFTFEYYFLQFLGRCRVFFARNFTEFGKYKYPKLKDIAYDHHITYLSVKDINSNEVLQFARKKQVDVLVSCLLMQIIKKPLLDIPLICSINYHPALVQSHRGFLSAFWVLVKNWKRLGATVHYMTEKVDDGDVILQKKFFVHPADTMFSISDKSAEMGGLMLASALTKIQKKQVQTVKIKKLAPIYTYPTEQAVRLFRKFRKKIASFKDIFHL